MVLPTKGTSQSNPKIQKEVTKQEHGCIVTLFTMLLLLSNTGGSIMKKLNILLYEDEKVSKRVTEVLLEEYLIIKKIKPIVTVFTSYSSTDISKYKKADIVILDIDLKGSELNGVEVAKQIRKENAYVPIIFTTKYEDFALEASTIHMSGFLKKPLNPDDFEDTLHMALVQLNGFRTMVRQRRTVKVHNGKTILKESDIISIVKIANSREVEIRTTNEVKIFYENIKDLKERLSDSFIKINRSTIVNRYFILKIEGDTVIMKNGDSFSISVRQEKYVKAIFTEGTNAF